MKLRGRPQLSILAGHVRDERVIVKRGLSTKDKLAYVFGSLRSIKFALDDQFV